HQTQACCEGGSQDKWTSQEAKVSAIRAGAVFILTGLAALLQGGEFLQPLLDNGVLGGLVSAGTLPLLYLAVGLKVGAELAGLMARLADVEVDEP
ncbi:MAG: hypothetical protein M3H12_18580, partial [Chromatiales bacterium]